MGEAFKIHSHILEYLYFAVSRKIVRRALESIIAPRATPAYYSPVIHPHEQHRLLTQSGGKNTF